MPLKKLICLIFILAFFGKLAKSQFGAGLTFGIGIYNWYQNPNNLADDFKRSSGAIGGFHLGPKLWLGGKQSIGILELE